ncbi:MAG: DUF881 domain-containing protein [Nocardioides sp.]
MTHGSHARPPEADDGAVRPPARRRPRLSGPWAIGTPLVGVLGGVLFAVSAHNAHGTDLRPGRYTDLASLVSSQSRQYDALKQRVAGLNQQVADLTGSVSDRRVTDLRRKTDRLRGPAGVLPVSGPGVTITLSDAPHDTEPDPTLNVNRLLVHQQDIQAVVNALWKGGASAVTIQGQRVVSTTGIRCVGNSVQLQGVPYSQPYVIAGVGDPSSLAQVIDSDGYIATYRADAANPQVNVGWDLQAEQRLTAPAYDGLLDLSFAKVLPTASAPAEGP